MSDIGGIGSLIGPYRLEELLGRGGMGEVFRAYDTAKNRVVALKLLRPNLADDPVYQERFRRESHAAARLGEPHVIPIHDWGEIDGLLYIDMRFVEGPNLRGALRQSGALEPARAVTIVEQVAAALDAAHREGLVHRDVKPENILLTDGDFAYLVDFGIAHSGADLRLTQTGTTIGSVAYMAPELFDSDAVSPASDIYALTCVLFECLTGQVPHPANTISAAIKAAIIDPAPLPSATRHDVPTAFDEVIKRGLHRDPAIRYHSARALAVAARRALQGEVPGAREENRNVEGVTPTAMLTASPFADSAVSASAPTAPPGGPQPWYGAGPPPPPGPAPAAYPPPAYPVMPQPWHNRSIALPVLVGVIAAALIGLLALGGYWLLARQSDDSAASTPTTPTVTQVVTPPQAGAGPTETTTVTAPPQGSSECGVGVAAGTSITSCPFAVSVRDEYLRTGPMGASRVIVAYSPVTGTTYQMACVPEGGLVACRGGNDAVVYIY